MISLTCLTVRAIHEHSLSTAAMACMSLSPCQILFGPSGCRCCSLLQGQGLLPSQSTTVGASNTLLQLQELYSSSQAWRRAFKQQPKSACSKATGTSLCAPAATDAVNTYAQLMLATSPSTYSSTADSRVNLVSPAQDQGPCHTCAAFAVAAAAETAIASALQVDVQLCSISVQALHFCPPGRPGRSCSSGWNLAGALEQLQQQAQNIPTASCLPYQPDVGQELTAAQLCTNKCSSTSWRAGQGFSSLQITSYWEAQMHIRRFGAVVSRFDVRELHGGSCMQASMPCMLLAILIDFVCCKCLSAATQMCMLHNCGASGHVQR